MKNTVSAAEGEKHNQRTEQMPVLRFSGLFWDAGIN